MVRDTVVSRSVIYMRMLLLLLRYDVIPETRDRSLLLYLLPVSIFSSPPPFSPAAPRWQVRRGGAHGGWWLPHPPRPRGAFFFSPFLCVCFCCYFELFLARQ